MARPVCGRLGLHLEAAAQELELAHQRGGTYLVMEGPQFSTLAESHLYRTWGCDVIGMTNMPEAKLAREAELCYATVAMVTDFDSWHPEHDAVTVDQVVATLLGNAERARALIKAVVPRLAARATTCTHGCHTALDAALITAPAARDPRVIEKLGPLVARALGRPGEPR
jgi:5'-methylthioadenosine phosphorylase